MAFVTANAGVKVQIKSQSNDFWNAITNNQFVDAIPDLYESIIIPNPSNLQVRKVTYGSSSQNIKTSTERIVENSDEKFIYTVVAGDILTKYEVSDFRATISYPADKWVEWSWTYKYLKDGKSKALDLDVEIADIVLKSLSKLDAFIQKKQL